MVIDMKKSKKTIKRTLCLILSASMSLTLAGCGKEETSPSAITDKNQEIILEQVLGAQVNPSHSSKAGKEETVYVLADAKGGVNQVIVSDWLKNRGGGQNLTDCSDLT
ncbi:MAG: YgdI/YgdR family lipoprotein, partial [Lachnospiraceae bacterium]|nr:YgdI/YgdR family lipoprotein [Lachnospiraceae bacterium]